MKLMDYRKVDILTVGQLEPEDLIEVDNEIVNVVEVIALNEGYSLEIVNDFGEREIIHCDDFEMFSLFIFD
jgi:hypothetical protein